MAKQLDAPYIPGKRKGMAKVKRERTIDCVVMGWRPGKEEGTVGSLILGLYDGDELRTVGHISGFSAAAKRSMRAMLAPLETGESGTAEPSRWTGGRDLEWVELRPELVIEVGYDHAAAGRIRHGARFHRFRDDKAPRGVQVRAAGRRGLAGGPTGRPASCRWTLLRARLRPRHGHPRRHALAGASRGGRASACELLAHRGAPPASERPRRRLPLLGAHVGAVGRRGVRTSAGGRDVFPAASRRRRP